MTADVLFLTVSGLLMLIATAMFGVRHTPEMALLACGLFMWELTLMLNALNAGR